MSFIFLGLSCLTNTWNYLNDAVYRNGIIIYIYIHDIHNASIPIDISMIRWFSVPQVCAEWLSCLMFYCVSAAGRCDPLSLVPTFTRGIFPASAWSAEWGGSDHWMVLQVSHLYRRRASQWATARLACVSGRCWAWERIFITFHSKLVGKPRSEPEPAPCTPHILRPAPLQICIFILA